MTGGRSAFAALLLVAGCTGGTGDTERAEPGPCSTDATQTPSDQVRVEPSVVAAGERFVFRFPDRRERGDALRLHPTTAVAGCPPLYHLQLSGNKRGWRRMPADGSFVTLQAVMPRRLVRAVVPAPAPPGDYLVCDDSERCARLTVTD